MTDYLTVRDRPLGITILSILHFVGGVALAIGLVAFAFVRVDPQVTQALSEIGIPLPLLIAGIGFLAVLGIASAIGMWKGKTWGWYLGSFSFAYAIVRNVNALVAVYDLSNVLPAEELADASRGPGYYYMKFGIRTVVSLLLFMYFFKANVRAYFGLVEARLWKAAVAEFVLCIVIALVAAAAAQWMQ